MAHLAKPECDCPLPVYFIPQGDKPVVTEDVVDRLWQFRAAAYLVRQDWIGVPGAPGGSC